MRDCSDHPLVSRTDAGKAGGFLALDWNDSSPVGPLSRKSFALHAQLAERFGADNIGYRRTHTLQVRLLISGLVRVRVPVHVHVHVPVRVRVCPCACGAPETADE